MSQQRELCVLFADIAGSTRLYETLGDAAALRMIERCLAGLQHVTRANGGRVVKTIGDEVMAVFDTAAQGMQAASEMLRAVDALPAPAPGVHLAKRMESILGPHAWDYMTGKRSDPPPIIPREQLQEEVLRS